MINKTFLILLLASLTYTVYNAAAVSETFEISTTIDHEITLGSFRAASTDVNIREVFGASFDILINPNYDSGFAKYDMTYGGGVIAFDPIGSSSFKADLPDPDDVSKFLVTPSSITKGNITVSEFDVIHDMDTNYIINPKLSYSGGAPKAGDYNFGSVTISYNP
ncbi:MAG: hypothetical protein IJ689_01800 [Alphaproteobacteria bacterium]|nr:hypothetical protein [Alphaproteobacteria bacterium]